MHLYRSRVMHRRLKPFVHRFTYDVYGVLVDVTALASTRPPHWRWLSHNRFNLMSLMDADHGARDGSELDGWARRTLAAHGIAFDQGRISMFCFPRILGHGFNPLSLWFCERADGSLCAVLCEVRNTFGEQHVYVIHDDGAPLANPVRSRLEKTFHVSPFISMDCTYHFTIRRDARRIAVAIRLFERGEPLLQATIAGRAESLTDRNLLRAFAAMPLLSLKVIGAIHWQALRLWLRGARYHPRPARVPEP